MAFGVSGFRVWGCRVSGWGFVVLGLGFGVWGLGSSRVLLLLEFGRFGLKVGGFGV